MKSHKKNAGEIFFGSKNVQKPWFTVGGAQGQDAFRMSRKRFV